MIELQLTWKNCVAFILGNASATLGIRNSIKSRAILKNNNFYLMGCSCHMIRNTSHRGSAGLTCNEKFDEKDLCSDIFFNKKSRKRKNIFSRLCRIWWLGVSWYLKAHKCMLTEFGMDCFCFDNFVTIGWFK